MLKATIVMDSDLSMFRGALEAAGFRVLDADDVGSVGSNVDVVVVDGMDDGMLGLSTPTREGAGAPVIDVTGMTADQLVAAVRERLAADPARIKSPPLG